MPPSSSGSIETLQQVTIRLKDQDSEIVFANLSLQERMLSTGHFSFVWKNDFNDAYADDQERFIQEYIGKELVISFEDHHTFKGIILEIHFFRNDGLTQEFNISGQGLGVKLQDQAQSASYYKKNLQHIIDDALRGAPSNALSIDNSPKNTSEQFYTVQYQETDFAFLSHLAIRFGEWFYYDGEQLVFGKLNDDALSLQAESDVYSASLSSQLTPLSIHATSYDNFQGEVMNHQSSNPSTSGLLNALSTASGSAYDRTPSKMLHLAQASTSEVLGNRVDLEVQARTARMILYSAKSRSSEVKVGRVIKIVSGNKSSEYIVVSVTHSSAAHQTYHNEFVAIPKSVTVPHYTDANWYPKCESQVATVTSNEDDKGHDRIKVHFPWQQDGEDTPWLKVATPQAGEGRGFRMIPEVDEEVIIGFERNNAEKPYVIGAMFNAKGKSGSGTSSNNLKSIQTKSGNRLELNDEDGSITVTDKGGNILTLDGSGKITLKCSDSLLIDAANNIELKSQNIKLNASVSVDIAGKTTVDVAANSVVTKATTISNEATADNTLKSNATVTIDGVNTSVKGSATAKVEGAMLDLSGTGITNVKGGILNLN